MRKLLLIPTLFFFACSPLRHYKKVALDPFRSAKERELLAKAANEEFPEYISDSTPQVTVEIDSSEVKRLNDAYAALLDDYLGHLENEPKTDTFIYNGGHSVDHYIKLREAIKALKPATITKTVTKEIKVIDGVWKEKKENEVKACREELRLMTFQKDELLTKKKNQATIIRWMIGVWVLLLAFIVMKPRIGKIFPIM